MRQRPASDIGSNHAMRRRAVSVALPLVLLAVAGARRAPPSPSLGTLTLDADAPFIDAELAGVPVRLRVTPAAQGSIDLAPAVAARLPVRWSEAEPIDVGRIRLPGREALAELVVAGMSVPVQVAEHGRAATPGDDGEVAPGVLPYATVRWLRHAAPEPAAARTLPLRWEAEFGYSAATEVPGVVARFDPAQAASTATAAAGARLARAWGGRWAGVPYPAPAAFGVSRTVRPLAFARQGTLAGFPMAALPVRLADFAGREALPTDTPEPGDLVVSRRVTPQHGWPAVTLGADRLGRCRELAFTAAPLALTLHCAP